MALQEDEEALLKQLQESVDSDPNNPSHHYNLGVFLWKKGGELREKALEHFVVSAKLNPNNGASFRFLGHFYSQVSIDVQRASKCYQRALALNPDDFEAGEAFCDLLDDGGKENLEVAVCQEASQKSPKAFWAFRRLGYLQVHQKKWPEAVQSLQQAIRGYPTCVELWETLGCAYQRLGMFSAALKSYGRALELEDSRVFALIESGDISLMLGSFRKGIELFQQALVISPENASALFGLASGLLGLSKECVQYGAFSWGASLLEEASDTAKAGTHLSRNASCTWKLHGDIQLAYAKCFPWTTEDQSFEYDEEALEASISSWKRKCSFAAKQAIKSYQRALHLTPWEANIYIDIAISADFIFSLEESKKSEPDAWQLSEKMSLGGLYLEGDNSEFWLALGCLSSHSALRQHALIRGLQLDVSLAVAWAHLGKLYRKEGEKQLSGLAFDHARSIDPSLALPWAGMSSDTQSGQDEAYERCLHAVQILPLAEFQIGLGKLAVVSGNLLSPQVFGAVRQAVQRAPHYPESHNLNGLVSEARSDYQSAVAAYRLARISLNSCAEAIPKSHICDISVNLARSLCLAGNPLLAKCECEGLEKEGLLDTHGLLIYAISLWQLGEDERALSVVRKIAASSYTMDQSTAATSISLICKLLYRISGQESTIASILKMPTELLKSSKISFIVSVINALDPLDRLKSVVSNTRGSLTSHEEITNLHSVIALSKLVRHASKESLGIETAINHLIKAVHKFPNSHMLRNQLGYFLLSSKKREDNQIATRCIVLDPAGPPNSKGLRTGYEILGAAGVACYASGTTNLKFSFPTCTDHFIYGVQTTQELERWLHQEPWNHNAQYLLVLNVLQQAREERFPRHLCTTLERVVSTALSSKFYSGNSSAYAYQRFQLLLCAAEISLQSGKYVGCINYAMEASTVLLPDRNLFCAHLLLCRAYAAQGDLVKLQEEYRKCLKLKTNYPIGWIGLKFLESKYRLQSDLNSLDSMFEECLEEDRSSWNIWRAIFELVRSQSFIWDQDFLQAKEALVHSCTLAGAESCLFLCHGVVCMEIARQSGSTQLLPLAIRSLSKAQLNAPTPLPFVSAVLAQAEASLGAKEKWERDLRAEWFSWPPVMRPAELYFQMHLLARQTKTVTDSSKTVECCQSPLSWLLRAIHLNPSSLRYWKLLYKVWE